MENVQNASAVAAAKTARDKAFWKKGLLIAIFSGFLYGGYTSFMTEGMMHGVWNDIYAEVPTGVAAGVSAFFIVYTVSAIGAACVDLGSAIWSLFYGGCIGRLGDFKRTLSTKPGKILIIAAIIGAVIVGAAAILNISKAGSISASSGLASLSTIFKALAVTLIAMSLNSWISEPVGALGAGIFVSSLFNFLTIMGVQAGTLQEVILGAVVIICGVLARLNYKGVAK